MENAKYIEVAADVRYYEDGEYHDQQGNVVATPFICGGAWVPVIDITIGKFKNWPRGTVANICYKVCDAGEYWLIDENMKRIAKWKGYYVPNEFLSHGDNGYGDYIIMKVDYMGYIEEFRQPSIDDDEWESCSDI